MSRSHPRLATALLLIPCLAVTGCSAVPGGAAPTTPRATAPPPAGSPPAAGSPAASPSIGPLRPPEATPLADPPAEPAGDGTTATIETELGTIEIELFTDSAPVAAQNFINLAQAGFYDGVVFHRLVPGFVIQGGDGEFGRIDAYDRGLVGSGGPGYTIQDEPVVGRYERGVVAMARTRQPDSQGSQFFIVLSDEAEAPLESARTYVIFGRVTKGMDVVDRIARMPNSGEPANQAEDPVAMKDVRIDRP